MLLFLGVSVDLQLWVFWMWVTWVWVCILDFLDFDASLGFWVLRGFEVLGILGFPDSVSF